MKNPLSFSEMNKMTSLELMKYLLEYAIETKAYLENDKIKEHFRGVELTLKDKEEIDKKYEENNGKHSYLRIIREHLMDKHKKIEYKYMTRFFSELYAPFYGYEATDEANDTSEYGYVKAVKRFEEQQISDKINATAEWRAYFEYRFLPSVRRFLESTFYIVDPNAKSLPYFGYRFLPSVWRFLNDSFKLPKIPTDIPPIISQNTVLWSFEFNKTLPLYRTHKVPSATNKTEEKRLAIYNMREDAFQNLASAQANYSFVWEIVGNNVTHIFYFDIDEANHDKMDIYIVNPDAEGNRSRGIPTFIGKCSISALHRGGDKNDTKTLYDIENKSSEPFEVERKKNEAEEKKYQYSVIRWMIRVGILDLTNLAKLEGGKVTTYDLTKKFTDAERKEAAQVLKAQYNTVRARKGFLLDETSKDWASKDGKNCEGGIKYSSDDDKALDKIIAYMDNYVPKAINDRLATFELGFFKLTQEDNTISHIYWLPIITNWRTRKTGGSVFLNADKHIGMSDSKLIIDAKTPVPQIYTTVMQYYAGLFVPKQIEEIERLAEYPALTAAAISIMARNISHNIASHVLAYIKNILTNEETMLHYKVFENLIVQEKDGNETYYKFNEKILSDGFLDKDEFAAPYLRALGDLLGYFQERQDYVGAVASNWKLYYGFVPFEDLVANYFAADKEDKRVNSEDVKHHNLILDFIAYSEGYKREDIVLNFQYKNKKNEIKTTKGIDVALPAGTTGRQAVYTILENVIRNSAKHGSRRKQMTIDFTLSELNDNPNYYKVELTDYSNNATDEIVRKIQEVLKKPLIKPDGTIDEENKGVKEMQIAAAWLRDIKPYELTDFHDLPILAVKKEGENIKYTFYLRKPKLAVVLVGSEKDKEVLCSKFKEEVDKNYFDIEKFAANKDWKDTAYRFVVRHESVQEAVDKNKLPIRNIALRTEQLSNHKTKEDFGAFLYEHWLDHKKPNGSYAFPNKERQQPSSIPIGIYDPKDKAPKRTAEEHELVIIDTDGDKVYDNSQILFRAHNDTRGDFERFEGNDGGYYYSKQLFIEGITGSNSTNRLLRSEKITPYWTHKMREAALTKVLIIDERIWANARNRAKEDESALQFEFNLLHKKNIHILTAEEKITEGVRTFEFTNLMGKKKATMNKDLTFKWSKGKAHEYHFIAIHQGILDKMFNFAVADKNSEQLEKLFGNFKKVFQADYGYLVHSGRSKTPNIPKNSAFLQLSALDAGLGDCKFTLTELLYAAINENQNS